jgi:hypothetical protein
MRNAVFAPIEHEIPAEIVKRCDVSRFQLVAKGDSKPAVGVGGERKSIGHERLGPSTGVDRRLRDGARSDLASETKAAAHPSK